MNELTAPQSAELSLDRNPDTMLAEASLVAQTVQRLVVAKPDLVQVIGGRKHPRFELLQIVASMFRVAPRIRETRRIEPDGWEAIAEAVHVPTGQIISVADGMCAADEPEWGTRGKYEWVDGRRHKVGEVPVTSHQRRSMAQTRAASKALRLALGWVLGLAGYEASAAEEFTGPETARGQAPRVRRKTETVITEAQAKRLWAIAREAGRSDDEVRAVLRAHGYEHTRDVRITDYDAIIGDLQGGTHTETAN